MLQNEGNQGTVVYKRTSNNQLERLEKEKTKEYAPPNRTGLQNARHVAAIFGHCGNFLRGAAECADVLSEFGKLKNYKPLFLILSSPVDD